VGPAKDVNCEVVCNRTALGIVVLLTLASIAVHECGHYLVYKIARYPVRITLQSVRPIGYVNPRLDYLALAAGPAFSLIAAVLCLLIASRRPNFVWVTAAFTNATLRLFPLTMDVLRAIAHAKPFSDEGNVAIAMTTLATGRATLVLGVMAIFVYLSVRAARHYDFEKHHVAKSVGIYLLSLSIGIAVVVVDELLK
jgi:hypothetical protein